MYIFTKGRVIKVGLIAWNCACRNDHPTNYNPMVHATAVLKFIGWWNGVFEVRNLHFLLSGLYTWISRISLFLASLRGSAPSVICVALVSTYNSPFIAINPQDWSAGTFLRRLDSFNHWFKAKSYLHLSQIKGWKLCSINSQLISSAIYFIFELWFQMTTYMTTNVLFACIKHDSY